MTDNNGISISNVVASAAVWAPGEQGSISFKFKNGGKTKIIDLMLFIELHVSDFTGTASSSNIVIAKVVGPEFGGAERVNLAAGKSKTYSASFTIPETAAHYFGENTGKRAVPIYINYTATDSDGGFGTEFELEGLKVINHRFNPNIDEMELFRATKKKVDGVDVTSRNDEGENVLTTLKFGVNSGGYDYKNYLTAKIYRAEGEQITPADDPNPITIPTANLDQLLSGVTESPNVITDSYDKAKDWDFLLAFGDQYEMFYGRFNLAMAFANMHLSGRKKGGVCFGGFSTSTDTKPKLESYFPAYFKSGISQLGEKWEQLTPLNGTTPADLGGGALRCRKVENKRIIEGSIKVKGKVDSNGDDVTVLLAELPDDYTPEKAVFSINACKGGRVARIVVGGKGETNAGYLCLSWIKNLSNGSSYTSESIWVQCSIEYWVEATEEDTPSTANMIDSNGAVVIDDDGKAFSVRETGDQIYQSRYTGLQIDDGIQAAYNAASKTYVENAINEIELTPGPAGPAGPQGPAGPTGPAGAAGAAGAAGKDGVDGKNGKSAYEYAKDAGYTGTEEEFANKLAEENEAVEWIDIQNKPFGNPITGSVVIDGDTLRWDGDTTGMATVEIERSNYVFVSDNTPSLEKLKIGCDITAHTPNGDQYYTLMPNQYVTYPDVILLRYTPDNDLYYTLAYVVLKPNASFYSGQIERAGLYLSKTFWGSESYIKEFTLLNYPWTVTKEIGPIPEKYIPDTITRAEELANVAEELANVSDIANAVDDRFEHSVMRITAADEIVVGNPTVYDPISQMRYIYVSDYVPERVLFKNGYRVYTANPNQTIVYSGDYDILYDSDNFYHFNDQAWVIMQDDLWVNIPGSSGGRFPKRGTYFALDNDGKLKVVGLGSDAMSALGSRTILSKEHIPVLSELIMVSSDGSKLFKLTIDSNGNLVPTEI